VIKLTIGAAATVLIAALVAMPADGKADGTFTVKGKATKLAYAYAKAQSDPSDKTKTKEEIVVILSDTPLTPALVNESMPFGMQDLTRANKLHALRATIDSSKALTGVSMFDGSFKMSSVSTGGTYMKLDLQTFNKTTIAGKLYTTKPLDFNDVPYEYSVTFSAPITR
jgi:hypothetical protein